MLPTSSSQPPLPSWWAEGEAIAASELSEGIALLVETAELMAARLGSSDCGRNEELGTAKDLTIRVFVAETLSQVDAAIALLSVGCFDQIEPLLRSLHDLVVDLYLIVADDAAFDIWVNWQTVEAAMLALKMDPEKRAREGRDLVKRRAELASQLRQRLGESHPDAEAKLAADADLSEVLRMYSKNRLGRGFPGSWRNEYQHGNNIDRDALINRVAKSIWDVVSDGAPVLLEGWGMLIADVEAQFGPMYGYWSGETHNSPMAMARKVDVRSLAPSVHGSVEVVAAPIGGIVMQVFRVMAVFERLVCSAGDQGPWESLMERALAWVADRGPPPLPFWFAEAPVTEGIDQPDGRSA